MQHGIALPWAVKYIKDQAAGSDHGWPSAERFRLVPGSVAPEA